MKHLVYILQAFGYSSFKELNNSLWHYSMPKAIWLSIELGLLFGTLDMFLGHLFGIPSIAIVVFVILIMAEWLSGIQVARKIHKQKFESRKFGRMFIKIGTYLLIIFMLYQLSEAFKFPSIGGFEMDPLYWMYMVVTVAIVFQLVISWMENLGKLGYKEADGVLGILVRKFNAFMNLNDDPAYNPDSEMESKDE